MTNGRTHARMHARTTRNKYAPATSSKLGGHKKQDPVHMQIIAPAQRLKSEEDYDLAESYAWALKKRKFLFERIPDFYEPPKLPTTEE